jgi:hypothetical protein
MISCTCSCYQHQVYSNDRDNTQTNVLIQALKEITIKKLGIPHYTIFSSVGLLSYVVKNNLSLGNTGIMRRSSNESSFCASMGTGVPWRALVRWIRGVFVDKTTIFYRNTNIDTLVHFHMVITMWYGLRADFASHGRHHYFQNGRLSNP